MPAGCCFTPDHDDEALSAYSLNPGDHAALTTVEAPDVAGLCFTPDLETEALSPQRLNGADQTSLALI